MNNTFNINRFGLLLKRQWLDFGKIYLITLGVVIGIIVGFYAWYAPSPSKFNNFDSDGNLDLRFRYGLFLILGFIFISVVASSYFALFGQKARAIMELMNPASIFEKFLSGVLYTAVLSVLSYLILFYLVDLAFVKYLNGYLSEFTMSGNKGLVVKPAESIAAQFIDDANYRNNLWYFTAIPFFITSIFLLGSIYFNRFHYIKTAISVMIFFGAASYIIYNVINRLTRNMVSLHHGGQNKEDIALILLFSITAGLALILWAITYIRLKEKEV
ncbi:hypothetical protein [Pedobacter sandarakinus]|uniref:hypothetical protein n=1 Tax=Pedobacter sandarakinus TaxID=353156 RepID=UPI0022473843|nr:hypothetical protein [Pedobacter sandarakinus]MCX2573480.1 hypothetical protein [Pedobacter sandarakinus]